MKNIGFQIKDKPVKVVLVFSNTFFTLFEWCKSPYFVQATDSDVKERLSHLGYTKSVNISY